MSRDVVIVSTARTPVGKAFRGAVNDTPAQELAGHVIANAVSRAGIEGADIEDVVLDAALQQGATGTNTARQCAQRAGLPTTVPGMSIDRQCASGLMAISVLAGRISLGENDIAVAGGLDSISLVSSVKKVTNRETGEVTDETAPLSLDEGLRKATTAEGLAGLKPVFADGQVVKQGQFITAGNDSQLSDGATALVLIDTKTAEKRGLTPMAIYRGVAVAGCKPDEMGIDPAKLNVSGGAISIGHPFEMSGARMAGHILHEGRRRGAKYGVVTMCMGDGMGAAGLFELL